MSEQDVVVDCLVVVPQCPSKNPALHSPRSTRFFIADWVYPLQPTLLLACGVVSDGPGCMLMPSLAVQDIMP